MLQQQIDRGIDPFQRAHREQALQGEIQVGRTAHAARCVDPLQHGMQIAAQMQPGGAARPPHHPQGHRKLSSTGRERRQNLR